VFGEKWASLTHPTPADEAEDDTEADATPAMPSKNMGTASAAAASLMKREILIDPPQH
jgi:hypothetical protein